ncbi:hypothetical protein JHL18_01580 [Clostridium sp. YIM B02505]|uniref:GNAT family N-acetyltransferase n=1 Tax=Clostridium yunnanense TaxID=2800325 RepID=A0ABS1EIZ4_9CLOT|nr:hypothetical protein [Clostridium yunnanense]MBK1809336.1 hypothetical protein [Clostridium yunnanense]
MFELEQCIKDEVKHLKNKYNLKINHIINESSYKIIYNGKVIALIDFIESDDIFEILHFEVFEKSKGYGKLVILELLKCKYLFKLDSLESSIGFWKKMGFEMCNHGDEINCFYDNR